MRRMASASTAATVLVLSIALVVAGAIFSGLQHQLSLENYWLGAFIGLAFTAVGAIVAYRRPSAPMGWLMLAVGGWWALSIAAGEYGTLDYGVHHGHLPLGWLAVLAIPGWAGSLASFAVAIVLFPDGRPPSHRWRWPLRGLGALIVAWVLVTLAAVVPLLIAGTVRIDSNGDIAQLQGKRTLGARLYGGSLALLAVACALMIIAWLVSQLVSYRRLRGERRIQQKWILAGVVTSFISIVFALALGNTTVADLASFGIVAMPITMGVGILKYRLYEIDRIVSRTLSYAIVTALLVGVFVGLIALTTDLLPFSSSVGVAASTLAAAALLQPLRKRVQRTVDRRFNRARYDAEATVTAFATRLRDAVDLDAIQAELLHIVREAVEPTHATVWMRRRSG
jgi:MFS family permease